MLNGEPVQIVKIRDDDHRLVLKTFLIIHFIIDLCLIAFMVEVSFWTRKRLKV